MTKEIEKEFFDRFEFIETSGDSRQDAMVWGLECGDGWRDLIWKLCEDIEDELKKISDPQEFAFRVVQIKEKFGGLRYYVNWGTDSIDKLIAEAEKKSYTVCEVCGKEAELRKDNGWLSTVCEIHRE